MPKINITKEDQMFANISNDFSLAGSGLEGGNNSPEYSKYVLKLLNTIDLTNPELSSIINIKADLESIAEPDRLKAATQKPNSKNVTFYSGWNDFAAGNNSYNVIASLKYSPEGDLRLYLYDNEINRPNFAQKSSSKGMQYATAKVFSISKETINPENLQLLITALTTPNHGITDYELFYLNLQETLFQLVAKEENPQDHKIAFSTVTRAATSGWKTLMAFIRNNIPTTTYSVFKYELKLAALIDYYDYILHNGKFAEPLVQQQLLLACENLSRLIKKLQHKNIISDAQITKGLKTIVKITNSINTPIAPSPINSAITEMDNIATIKVPVDTLNANINILNISPQGITTTSSINFATPNFDKNHIIDSFNELQKFINNSNSNDIYQKGVVENFINSIELPLDTEAFKVIISDKNKIQELTSLLLNSYEFISNYSAADTRYESALAKLTIRHIVEHIAQNCLNVDRYRFETLDNRTSFGIDNSIIRDANYKSGIKEDILRADLFLYTILYGINIGVSSDFSLDKVLTLNPKLTTRYKYLFNYNEKKYLNLKHIRQEARKEWMYNFHINPHIRNEQDMQCFNVAFDANDPTMDLTTATKLFLALNSMSTYNFQERYCNTYFHDNKYLADMDIIETAEPSLSYSEENWDGTIATKTRKAFTFIPKIDTVEATETELIKQIFPRFNTELLLDRNDTAEKSLNKLASHPKHTMAHREFLYDLNSIYLAQNSAIAFIYEIIIKYPDKFSSSYFQNIIFVNLFRNGNIEQQIDNDPQGLEDFIELLNKKIYQFYSSNSLNNNLIFMLRITTMLEAYLLQLTNKNAISTTEIARSKLKGINNLAIDLLEKYPNNLDLHIIRILRLQGQMFNKKIDFQNIVAIFTSLLMLNTYSYMVAGDLKEPWLYKTLALDLIIANEDAIAKAFADDSRRLIAQIIANVSSRELNPETINGTYPEFVAELIDGTVCNINVFNGTLKIADNKLRDTPSQVYNTSLYQYHFGKQLFVGTFEENRSFTFEDINHNKYIYELNGNLLRRFKDGEDSDYYEYSENNSQLSGIIPASMLDKRHDLWLGKKHIYITDASSKQPIYKLSDDIVIDIDNNTKLLIVDNNNAFIKQLTAIENKEFIEIWQSVAHANEYLLKLPRYNLEFTSNDNGKTFIWKNDPRYQLTIPSHYDLLQGYNQYLVLEAVDKSLGLPKLAIIPQQKLFFDINSQNAILDTTKFVFNPKENNYFASAKVSVININKNKFDPTICEQFLHLAYIMLTADQTSMAQQMLKKAALSYRGAPNELHWLEKIIDTEISVVTTEGKHVSRFDKSLATHDAIKAFAISLCTLNSDFGTYLQSPENKNFLKSVSKAIAKYYNNLNNIPRKLRLSHAQELSVLQQIKSDVTAKRLWQLEQNLVTDTLAPPEYVPENLLKSIILKPEINTTALLEVLSKAKNTQLPEFNGNQDYKILLDSPALILNALLKIHNLNESEEIKLENYIHAMTKIFFNPDGTTFSYLQNKEIYVMSSQQIAGINALLVIFNYIIKHPNKVSTYLGNNNEIQTYINQVLEQHKAKIYRNKSFSELPITDVPSLATLFNALPYITTNEFGISTNILQNNLEFRGILTNILQHNLESLLETSMQHPIEIDYTKPIVEQHEINFPALPKLQPKPLDVPKVSNEDPIAQYMKRILTTAGLTLAKADEFSLGNIEYTGDSYDAIIRKEFDDDYRIGQAQNTAKTKLHETFAAELSPESLNKIHNSTQDIVKDLNMKLVGFKDKILKDANFISHDKKPEAAIELNSGHKHKLTFADLLKLFILQDENEYLQQTFLNSEQIAELQQQIFDYLLLETELQHLQRILQLTDKTRATKDLQEQIALKEELAGLFEGSRSYEVNKNLAVLVFEYLDNKLIRKTQAKYLVELLKTEDGKFNNILAHIIMGGGKSKILLPLLAQMKATKDNLAIVLVSREMYQTNLADLSKLSTDLFRQQLYEFEFSRDTKCDGDFFRNWYYKLLQIVQDGAYVLTTPESLQSLDLKFFELLRYGDNSQQESVQYLSKILQLLKTNGDLIIDEIDQNLQTRKELNYSIGDKTNINEAYPNLISDAVEFFEYLEQNFTISEIITGKRLLLTTKEQERFANDVTTKLLNDLNSVLYKALLISESVNLNINQKQELHEYLRNKEKALPEFINEISSDPEQSENRLAFFRENLSSLLIHTLSKHKNEHYGLRHTPGDVLKSNIAVPYIGAKTPSKRSEFLSILEQLNYTLQSQIGDPISIDIFKLILNDFYKKYINALNDSIAESEEIQESFNILAGLNVNLKDITFEVEQLEKIYAQITPAKHQILQQFALTNFILPSIDFNEIQLRSTPQNLIRIARSVQGFTGTPYNYRTLLSQIKFEPSLSSGTDGQTVDNILKNTTAIHKVADHDSLINIFAHLNSKDNIHALIDQGAYCRHMQNVDVAYALREIYQDSEIKYILFFNEDNRLAAMPVDRSLPIKAIGSSDPSDIYAAIQTTPEHYFAYYDQRHATGVDIKQTSLAHALVTVSETVILRDLLQAAMRMRGLANKQKLEFIVPNSIAGQINSAEDIVNYCLNNQIETLANDHYAAAKQQISAIIIEQIRSLIIETNDIDKAKGILEHCNHLFFTESTASLFEQYGIQLELLPTSMGLQQFADAQIASLQKLLDLNIITAEHKTTIEQNIAKVIEQIVPVCKPEEYANAQISYEQEQEREQQLEQEQEQELEFQIENEILDNFKRHPLDSERLTKEKIIEILQQNCANLISLNAAFHSAAIKRNWSFKDNLFQTKGMAITTFEQKNGKDHLLKYKREIYQLLIVKNPKTLKSIYVCLTPTDAQEIINYCNTNSQSITNEIKIVTLNGHSHYNLGPNSLNPKDSEYKLAIQQLGYYNGDISFCLKNKAWLQEDFISKQSIFIDYIIKNHPNRIALLTKAPELFGKRVIADIAETEIPITPAKKSFKGILWDIFSFPFRMLVRAFKAFINSFTASNPKVEAETTIKNITSEVNDKLKELSPKLAEMVIKHFQIRIQNAKSSTLAERQKIIADWQAIEKPLLENNIKGFCDAVEKYIKLNKRTPSAANNMLKQYDSTAKPSIDAKESSAIIKEIRALRKFKAKLSK